METLRPQFIVEIQMSDYARSPIHYDPPKCPICGYQVCQHLRITDRVAWHPFIYKWLKSHWVVELRSILKPLELKGAFREPIQTHSNAVMIRESASGVLWGSYMRESSLWTPWEPFVQYLELSAQYNPDQHTAYPLVNYQPQTPIQNPIGRLQAYPEDILFGGALWSGVQSNGDFWLGMDNKSLWIQKVNTSYRFRFKSHITPIRDIEPFTQWAVSTIRPFSHIELDSNCILSAEQADCAVDCGFRVKGNVLCETEQQPHTRLWRTRSGVKMNLTQDPYSTKMPIGYPTIQDLVRARTIQITQDPETREIARPPVFWKMDE